MEKTVGNTLLWWSISLSCSPCWIHGCRPWRRQSRSHSCRSSRKSLRSLISRRSRALRHLKVSGTCPPGGTGGNCGGGRDRSASARRIRTTLVRHCIRLGVSCCCCGTGTPAPVVEYAEPAPVVMYAHASPVVEYMTGDMPAFVQRQVPMVQPVQKFVLLCSCCSSSNRRHPCRVAEETQFGYLHPSPGGADGICGGGQDR